MKKINLLFIVILVLVTILPSRYLLAQRSSGGVPVSTIYSIPADENAMISLPAPDMSAIRKEDSLYASPYRFAVIIPVDISPEKSGKWEAAPGGERIWRASVTIPGALALSAYFDKFKLPEGGKLFLYNSSKTQVIGAFTSRNNSASGYFATELIAGDRILLEYSQPSGNRVAPVIHMNGLDYGYRGVGFLDVYNPLQSPEGICEVNVKCPEGDEWVKPAAGVIRLKLKKLGSTYWCTASLLNDVRNDHIPYVLTADHCLKGADSADLQQWIFYFNYDSPTCATVIPTTTQSLTGATLKAHGGDGGDTGSDFCLVLLNEDVPKSYDAYFNGWSRKDTTSPSGVGIHHPGGEVKKISTYNHPLVTDNYPGNPNPCHWRVAWIGTTSGHGVTEGGSSGSPLYDNHRRIVGTLTGGDSSCDSAYLNSPDYYGKFSWSWDRNGTDATTRLKDWLDPDNTGIEYMDGNALGIPEVTRELSLQLSPNPFSDRIRVTISGMDGQMAEMAVLNLMGSVVWSGSSLVNGSSSVTIALPGLPSGMYFLRVTFPGSVSVLKMIRQ